MRICKANFQQLRSEWVSWYHLISSPSAFWTVWHVFLSTHLCLWAGSNDCTHRRHLGFFWFGAFMKTSDSLAHCSLVILDSSHIVLVSYDISLEPLSWAGFCSCSCYREYKAESQNYGTEPQKGLGGQKINNFILKSDAKHESGVRLRIQELQEFVQRPMQTAIKSTLLTSQMVHACQCRLARSQGILNAFWGHSGDHPSLKTSFGFRRESSCSICWNKLHVHQQQRSPEKLPCRLETGLVLAGISLCQEKLFKIMEILGFFWDLPGRVWAQTYCCGFMVIFPHFFVHLPWATKMLKLCRLLFLLVCVYPFSEVNYFPLSSEIFRSSSYSYKLIGKCRPKPIF